MNEFEFIHSYLKPLAKSYSGALDLADDAAILSLPDGHEFVVTTDALTAGVHFFPDDPADLIAQKSLRVNLSDLASMGADPVCYSLALILPHETNESWLELFCDGLARDQAAFGIHLSGGDTTSTKGPLSIVVTAFGTVPSGQALKRSSARAGDDIWVSGTIGDALVGLKKIKENQPLTVDLSSDPSVQRYWLPNPKVKIARQLRGIATSAIDVSDGLVADLNHVCAASNVGAQLNSTDIPLTSVVKDFLDSKELSIEEIMTGGDDYELLFTVTPEQESCILELARADNINVTKIGTITAKQDLEILGTNGQPLEINRKGFKHF